MSSKRKKHDLDIEHGGKKKDKREETAEISDIIVGAGVKEKVKEAWRKKEPYTHGDIEVDCSPFPHCVLRNFIQDQTFVENLQRELLDLNFHDKSNDLYKFKQSDDLKKRKEPYIAGLRAVLFKQFRSWLTEVLQVELEPTVDLSCAKYEYTDVLLPHDDELEGRRIAFILYLVPAWGQTDGGMLDLYSTDENFQPQQVVKSLVPSWNTLVFFEVSPVSFHQVSEVISEEKCRLSVSGWFHGHSLDRPPRYIEPAPPPKPAPPPGRKWSDPGSEQALEALLFEWINPVYLDMDYQTQVQEEFEEASEILLKNFLKEEKFKEVNEALNQNEIRWVRRGPSNKRCYERADTQDLPPCVSACWELLSSESFFLLLSNFTGLKLHFLASGSDDEEEGEEEQEAGGEENEEGAEGTSRGCPATTAAAAGRDQEAKEKTKKSKEPSTPVCRGEVRRWRHGDYTLVHDTDLDNTEFSLDLLLHCGCEDWQTEFGGFTSYIANGEDEELLVVYPENNSLGLVYRDKETLKFVKHINHRSTTLAGNRPQRNAFYDFSFVYYE
ncbi:hypothetical protein SKAU_G00389330 [Synaphobranchus kaupii]|uniref:Prolyl 3-hydroxylase OGFOD1 n=1 Tax=Synaphobranchus kaupii TaxID=118154 RepID=A0A9Q1EB90_SYNKA|nr:hypothetical protein SKAU_G00389330 [Synaphobranchus kaupii]